MDSCSWGFQLFGKLLAAFSRAAVMLIANTGSLILPPPLFSIYDWQPLLTFLFISPKIYLQNSHLIAVWGTYLTRSKYRGISMVVVSHVFSYFSDTCLSNTNLPQPELNVPASHLFTYSQKISEELHLAVKSKQNLDLSSSLLFHGVRSGESELGCTIH